VGQSPRSTSKILATGLGAGILVDAVIIRSIFVPALVSILGSWNWYLPTWVGALLRVEPSPKSHRDQVSGTAQ
jgi:RND superfamily putative drug exporter